MSPDLVFDVGMHKGEDAAYYMKKGFRVVGFEADPDLVAHCSTRFASAIEDGQLTIISGAISDKEPGEWMNFYRNPSLSVWGTVNPAWAVRNERMARNKSEIFTIKTVRFSDAVRQHGMPYFIKIDIEGADGIVLDELKNFSERPQYISIESVETKDFGRLEQELAALRDLGYKRFRAVQQSNIPGSTIETKSIIGASIKHVFEVHASGAFGDDLTIPWQTFDECLNSYRRIFRYYKLFGGESWMLRSRIGVRFLVAVNRRGYPLPGWYDTHATF